MNLPESLRSVSLMSQCCGAAIEMTSQPVPIKENILYAHIHTHSRFTSTSPSISYQVPWCQSFKPAQNRTHQQMINNTVNLCLSLSTAWRLEPLLAECNILIVHSISRAMVKMKRGDIF